MSYTNEKIFVDKIFGKVVEDDVILDELYSHDNSDADTIYEQIINPNVCFNLPLNSTVSRSNDKRLKLKDKNEAKQKRAILQVKIDNFSKAFLINKV